MKFKSLKSSLLTITISGLSLLLVLSKTQRHLTQYTKSLPENVEFKDYNISRTTQTFHMVCLTHKNVKYQHHENPSKSVWKAKTWNYTFFNRGCFHQQKDITIYVDKPIDFTKKNFKLGFKINFKPKSELPKDYTVVNQTAYFMGNSGPKEPYNFYHFIKQIYYPLYWLVKSTNQLHLKAQNVVYYTAPYALCELDKRVVYYNPDKFRHFKDILHIKNKLELSAFVDKPDPHKICYKNAVFSSDLFLKHAKESMTYFKSKLNVRDDVCQPKTLTIINRGNYRRILNAEKLRKIAQDLGYNAKEVLMETLTVEEQTQLVHCTNVMVGVNGAGFQWAFFMKDNSSAFEIAWPDKEWQYVFSAASGPYSTNQMGVVRPMKFTQLKAKCIYNLKAPNIYAKDLYQRETNFTERQALDLFEDERNYSWLKNPVLNMGKLCDVIVDEEGFKKALLAVG